ncbi:MFS transporter [Asanoa iriomotensis]|uniref:MFS transporter n=1 Tax=Asanoa iriomotensis TaxID=234613 RepID=A0ABQ4C6P0_9ACTN|nr:MFS transporter [Asanoa iriomotensis]GIF58446.1 MFS transporter [Asanoa iriomotensis]
MSTTPASVKRIYYVLTVGNTLAASLIWGINTIFLLDAGLTNLEAFAANAFYTAGMVLFEVPTGIVADLRGRRASFLLGTLTLAVTTALYVLLWHTEAPFWQWAVVSALLGLGFTFFSGATEAWLVDALTATGFDGQLDAVFARAQVASGAAMLAGSAGGGYLAQLTNLGVPFVVRAAVLVVMFVVAAIVMRDLGFTPNRGGRPLAEIRRIVGDSVDYGWRVPSVRYLMLAAPFVGGVGVYIFYALQPYLLELYGDPQAYGVAGLVAALLSAAQIAGGFGTTWVRARFRRRTSALLFAGAFSVVAILLIGLVTNFWVVLALIMLWGLVSAATMPIRQAFINALIPSSQRATILSFDSLMSSTGGVVAQPVLGRVADVWNYPTSYVVSGVLSAFALPFLALSRAQRAPADTAVTATGPVIPAQPAVPADQLPERLAK